MIAYHIVFSIACVAILYNIRSCLQYLRSIDNTVALALRKPVAEALKDNKHHKKSLRTAINEHKRLMSAWFTGHASFMTMVSVWYLNSGTGELSEFSAFLAAIALTATLARPFTTPIDWNWLVMWNSGVQAVHVICHRESIVDRIAEIKACDDAASDPMAYIELELLHGELERIDRFIGTALGSPQSESVE